VLNNSFNQNCTHGVAQHQLCLQRLTFAPSTSSEAMFGVTDDSIGATSYNNKRCATCVSSALQPHPLLHLDTTEKYHHRKASTTLEIPTHFQPLHGTYRDRPTTDERTLGSKTTGANSARFNRPVIQGC